MLEYSQQFNDAIRSVNRCVVGRLTFNDDIASTIRGDTGLISFDIHQDAMDAERFCIGSTVSAYCNATFYNEGIPQGLDLQNSYFDAYIGVTYDENDGYPYGHTILDNYEVQCVAGVGADLPDYVYTPFWKMQPGTLVTVTINGVKHVGQMKMRYIAVLRRSYYVEVSDDNYKYRIASVNTGDTVSFEIIDLTTGDIVAGQRTISINGSFADYKCMGRFYVQSVDIGKFTTQITGYDVVGKLNVKYVQHAEMDEDMTGFWAGQILNDIIDQTGVNNGEHFTQATSSEWWDTYAPATIADGTCREQWEWFEQANMKKKGCIARASRTALGYIEEVTFEEGRDYAANYPAIDESLIYEDGLETKDQFTIDYMVAGTTDDSIVYGDASGQGIEVVNPYWHYNNFEWTAGTTRGELIFDAIEGESFIPMKLHFRGDPCIEVMDTITVMDGEVELPCVVMRIETTFNGGLEQTIECWGKKEEEYNMSSGAIGGKLEAMADFITEAKVVSPWNYQKYNSGYIHLWCRRTFTNKAFTQDGSVYVADIPSFAYPFDLVVENSIVECVTPAGVTTTPDTAIWIRNKGGGTGATRTQTGQYEAVKTTSGNATFHVNYEVHARMKTSLAIT